MDPSKRAFGVFDSLGNQVAQPQPQLQRQLIEQQVLIDRLQAELDASKPRTVTIALPTSVDFYGMPELEHTIGLILHMHQCGMDWETINARLMGLE